MAKNNTKALEKSREFPAAMSSEARDAQMSSLAYSLVEQRLRDGTATSQETCYFLKLSSPVATRQQKKLEKEIELLEAKTEAIKAAKRMDEVYMEAIGAFKKYSGEQDDIDEENL